ncbi:MAG: metallophosphoesterase [Burkholderiaceae bacterium]
MIVGIVAGCSSDSADEASQDVHLKYSWVVMGVGNQAIARVATDYGSCPLISVDNADTRMMLRAAAGTVAQRTTASAAEDSKPSAFGVSVCEAAIPANAQSARIGSRTLPMPKASPQRIVVLADTGCRMKKADNAFQSCNDANAWPLAQIASIAASLQPDLVMHIGDYHYRENACPSDIAGCKDSPWGYGWDTWEADLFKPAASLMKAAPWIVVRGNHEECTRAGQGWLRFLDTAAYSAQRSCDDPANDNVANYTAPYPVPLGSDTQVIVFDSAKTGKSALATTDPQFQTYQQQFATVAQLAAKSNVTSIFVNHHPILGYTPVAGGNPIGGNAMLLSVMSSLNATAYYPSGIQLAMHGHVHDFQAINFTSNHPATFVSGNGGDNVDAALPDPFPSNLPPATGVTLDRITHSTAFGFMLMERASGYWNFKAYSKTGAIMTQCRQTGNRLSCDKTGYVSL